VGQGLEKQDDDEDAVDSFDPECQLSRVSIIHLLVYDRMDEYIHLAYLKFENDTPRLTK
jgi:hypothetical protein